MRPIPAPGPDFAIEADLEDIFLALTRGAAEGTRAP